ncbi:hypothetical protein [Cellvibrio sp. PSBB023]|uniref:hypothetical protein n=1 Tax=Cellvibrio sp. PSBB023 TaxID=1945512 RepID=UPI00122E205E|nr:hypothetical protein [Cellvibrio sp. PSBB023]
MVVKFPIEEYQFNSRQISALNGFFVVAQQVINALGLIYLYITSAAAPGTPPPFKSIAIFKLSPRHSPSGQWREIH